MVKAHEYPVWFGKTDFKVNVQISNQKSGGIRFQNAVESQFV